MLDEWALLLGCWQGEERQTNLAFQEEGWHDGVFAILLAF
jgi:hypothetical protein